MSPSAHSFANEQLWRLSFPSESRQLEVPALSSVRQIWLALQGSWLNGLQRSRYVHALWSGVFESESTMVMSHAPAIPSGSLLPHAWSSPSQHTGEQRPVTGPPSVQALPTHARPGRHELPPALLGQQLWPAGNCWLPCTSTQWVVVVPETTHSCFLPFAVSGQSWRTRSHGPFTAVQCPPPSLPESMGGEN